MTPFIFAAEIMDKPISVSSIKDISPFQNKWIDALPGAHVSSANSAVSEIVTYASSLYDVKVDRKKRDDFIVALTNGLTPRQIILLGAMISLSETRYFLLKERVDKNEGWELRVKLGEASMGMALFRLEQYGGQANGSTPPGKLPAEEGKH